MVCGRVLDFHHSSNLNTLIHSYMQLMPQNRIFRTLTRTHTMSAQLKFENWFDEVCGVRNWIFCILIYEMPIYLHVIRFWSWVYVCVYEIVWRHTNWERKRKQCNLQNQVINHMQMSSYAAHQYKIEEKKQQQQTNKEWINDNNQFSFFLYLFSHYFSIQWRGTVKNSRVYDTGFIAIWQAILIWH